MLVPDETPREMADRIARTVALVRSSRAQRVIMAS